MKLKCTDNPFLNAFSENCVSRFKKIYIEYRYLAENTAAQNWCVSGYFWNLMTYVWGADMQNKKK